MLVVGCVTTLDPSAGCFCQTVAQSLGPGDDTLEPCRKKYGDILNAVVDLRPNLAETDNETPLGTACVALIEATLPPVKFAHGWMTAVTF
jgi:hypothetical protein